MYWEVIETLCREPGKSDIFTPWSPLIGQNVVINSQILCLWFLDLLVLLLEPLNVLGSNRKPYAGSYKGSWSDLFPLTGQTGSIKSHLFYSVVFRGIVGPTTQLCLIHSSNMHTPQ